MIWYYACGGSQEGPVSEEELKSKISSGEVKPEDLAWKDGMSDWIPVSSIPELGSGSFGSSPVSPSKVAEPGPAAAQSSPPVAVDSSPYQTPKSPVGPGVATSGGENIQTYMWQSIAATLLCCLPFGIVAIVYAAKVEGLKQAGDYLAAKSASDSAKLWVNLSVGAVLLLIVISVILNLLGFTQSPG